MKWFAHWRGEKYRSVLDYGQNGTIISKWIQILQSRIEEELARNLQ